MKYYVTFGYSHVHPITGERMRDYWIEFDEIEGISGRKRVYEKMNERFGGQWGLIYEEKDFHKEYFPKRNYDKKVERERKLTLDELFEKQLEYEKQTKTSSSLH